VTLLTLTNLRALVVYVDILVPVTFKCRKCLRAEFDPTTNPVTSLVTA